MELGGLRPGRRLSNRIQGQKQRRKRQRRMPSLRINRAFLVIVPDSKESVVTAERSDSQEQRRCNGNLEQWRIQRSLEQRSIERKRQRNLASRMR
jgi:hypothetical protein